MKYIKEYKFFEGINPLSAIATECEDILIPLRDAGLKTLIDFTNNSIKIFIRPGQDSPLLIWLKGFEDTFEHLVSYLKEEGFEIGHESCYEGDSREACPECGHDEILDLGFNDDMSFVSYECIHCGHEDLAGTFTTIYWNINTEKDLMEMLKIKIYGVELVFKNEKQII